MGECMKIASKKLSQRILNLGFAFIIALSAVTTSLPFINAQDVNAATPFSQGFESDTSGWLDSDGGTVTRVVSGASGVTSKNGSWHAVVSDAGPFTRFDGYRDTWTGNWSARTSVYLDPSWAAGEGFDYSVAANGSDDAHQRDYIFHVAKDTSTGDLMVAGSNNTNFSVREDLENINHYVVSSAGWYTLQHVFRNDGGHLSVDLNLLDSAGTVLFTETRSNIADTIPAEVGGNRYGWFTTLNVAGGLAIDNTQLDVTDPVSSSNVYFVNSPKYVRANNTVDLNAQIVTYADTSAVNFYIDGDTDTPIAGYDAGMSSAGYHWWRLKTPLAAGQHTITGEVEIYGSWYPISGSGTVYALDLPWAEYVIPQAGKVFRANDKVVRIKADDQFDQFKNMKTTINSTVYTVNRADCSDKGSYVLCDLQGLNLPEGTYTATTTTYTKANNRVDNLVSESFTIDNTKPTLTNFQIVDPQPVYSTPIAVTVDASDANGIKDVEFYVTAPRLSDGACDGNGPKLASTNGTLASGATYSGSLNTSGLDGEYCVNAIAGDAAGNHSSILRTGIVVDNTAPAAPVHQSPSNGAVRTTAQQATIDWGDVLDPSSPVTYLYQSSTSPVTNLDGSFTSPVYNSGVLSVSEIPTPNTPEGTYYWHVRACDSLDNCSAWSSPWTIHIDNTAPVVIIDSPVLDLTNSNVEVRASVTDENLRHYWFQIKKNGVVIKSSTVLSSGINNALLYTLIDDGEYTITAAARDLAGGTASSGNRSADVVKTVTIDATAPIVDSVKVMQDSNDISGDFTNERLITVEWASSNGDVDFYEYKNASGWHNVGSDTSFTGNIGGSNANADGTYTYCVRATDNADNTSPEVCASVTLDETAPVVSIAAPLAGAYGFINSIDVEAAIDDAVSYRVLVNSVEVASESAPFTTYALPVINGTYNIQIEATDVAGNVGLSSVTTVTVDNTAPLLLVNGYTGTSLTPTITGTTDNADDIVTVDGDSATVSAVVNGGGTYDWTYTLPTQTIGTHIITVVSADIYGNATTETATVVVESVPATETTPATTNTTVTPNGDAVTTNTDDEADVLGAQDQNADSSTSDDQAVLGTSTDVDGDGEWTVFGLVWYWWLLILAGLVALARLLYVLWQRRAGNNA